jgi:hypothetical protein
MNSLPSRRWLWPVRRLLVFPLATVLVALPLMWFPGSVAYASSDCAPTHCYGYAGWFYAPSMHGGRADIFTDCISLDPYDADSGDFVTTELWVGTNGQGDGSDWVEEGEIFGRGHHDLRWFWADQRPNGGGFNYHPSGLSTNRNTTYTASIFYIGNNTWSVKRDGNFVSDNGSTNNPPPSNDLNTGTEVTHPFGNSDATSRNLQYMGLADNWNDGWSNNGNTAATYATVTDANAHWINRPNSVAYSYKPGGC